jgi:hypothetical protein
MAQRNFLVRVSRGVVVAASVVFLGALLSGTGLTAEQEEETSALLAKLPQSKHLLAEGIKQAEKEEGVAISAKFEMEGDELSLSVYTAKQGRSIDAEHNTLMELAGAPTSDQWKPKKEVFEDKPHIARASMHLTLMQLTKLKLEDVVQKVAAQRPGTVYSVIPAIRDSKPVFDVLVATPDHKSVPLTLDLRTGEAIKK